MKCWRNGEVGEQLDEVGRVSETHAYGPCDMQGECCWMKAIAGRASQTSDRC